MMYSRFKYIHSLVAAIIAILFLLPFYWGVIGALAIPNQPPPRSVQWWPPEPHWANFKTLFDLLPMELYTQNSLIVAIVAVPVTVLIASLSGFLMTQSNARKGWFIWSITILMIPTSSIWLFRYQIFRYLGVLDSLTALILPSIFGTSPIFILLYYWAYIRIKNEVFEAALIEGATVIQTWWCIGQPLVYPSTLAVTILAFITYWNDFMSPVLYTSRPAQYTLPIGLELIKQLDTTNWPIILASAIYMCIPCIIVFAYLQRYLFGKSLSYFWGKRHT